MSLEITQEIIDQYLNQELTGAPLAALEQKIKSDPDFKKEIETQQFLTRGVNKFGEDQMRAKLKNIRAEVLATEQTQTNDTSAKAPAKLVSMSERKKSKGYSKLAIAATIALLVGALVFIFMPDPAASTSALYASNYEPYKADLNTKGGSADLLSSASTAYQNEDYELALQKFNQALTLEPNNAELQLLKGNCQLQLDQFDAASQTFKGIRNDLYEDEALWYQAMVFLKKGDESQTHAALKNIESDNKYYMKAQQILTKITH